MGEDRNLGVALWAFKFEGIKMVSHPIEPSHRLVLLIPTVVFHKNWKVRFSENNTSYVSMSCDVIPRSNLFIDHSFRRLTYFEGTNSKQ